MSDYGKIDPVEKGRWVEALRSGKFKQGRNCLKSKDGALCCLGVECEISGAGEWWVPTADAVFYKVGDDPRSGTLPEPIRKSLGLSEDAQKHLIDMNDNGQSFAQIADWIEATL